MCELGNGEPIEIATARRLACEAGIYPVVLSGDSVVLGPGPPDAGRQPRTTPSAAGDAPHLHGGRLHRPVRPLRDPPLPALAPRRVDRSGEPGTHLPRAPPPHPRPRLDPHPRRQTHRPAVPTGRHPLLHQPTTRTRPTTGPAHRHGSNRRPTGAVWSAGAARRSRNAPRAARSSGSAPTQAATSRLIATSCGCRRPLCRPSPGAFSRSTTGPWEASTTLTPAHCQAGAGTSGGGGRRGVGRRGGGRLPSSSAAARRSAALRRRTRASGGG